ncbi:hypothetical protein [Flectobacillus sp. BAB-3569]|uniref:hypothetical protein n=1 Tax=Flectobacillus sp. BAB-3569 TaxID=1509483 RepID=UPI000BA3B0B6|nr:hypothetical protein [Flectobacillus sp. BAB-3569]PAC33343.1 hypothetical protein BWI92_02210 [Flectobacillus sp. BAB-3569]
MILLISYNKVDYSIPLENLTNAIRGNAFSYWHHLNDTWIVRTDKSVSEFYNLLAPNISTSDRLLLVEIKRNYQGWLTKDAWNWLKTEFKHDSFWGI